jgi:hypothetical protein
MGKKARHNYQSSDFRRLVCFMAKDLGYDDKKIASTLGLQLIYFSFAVNSIPELSEALTKARENLPNEAKNGQYRRKIVSISPVLPKISTDIPDLDLDFSDINTRLL